MTAATRKASERQIEQLRSALIHLMDEVADIRGVDIESYKPAAFERVRQALKDTEA